MTEKCSRTRGKNRGQAFAVWRDASVTDGEDSAMEAMQMTRRDAAVNPASRITKWAGQLPDRDDAVLPLRQIRKRFTSSREVCLPFAPHTGEKDRRTFVSPPTQPVFRPSTRSERQKSRRPGAGGFVDLCVSV